LVYQVVLKADLFPKHKASQHALAPDAAPLRFAAQVKRRPLGGTVIEAENAMASSQSKKLTRRDFRKIWKELHCHLCS